MKSFKVIGSLIIFLIFGCLLLFFVSERINLKKASADSGFDSSWDSGGSDSSWDSGSSWDNDSSWDSSSSRSSSSSGGGKGGVGEAVFTLFFTGFVFFLVIVYVATSSKDSIKLNNSYRTLPKPPKISDAEKALLEKYGFTEPKVLNEAYRIYVDVQKAWSDNDIDKAKDVLSDALYNQYKGQLIGLKAKKQINFMSDFRCVDGHVIGVHEQGDSINVNVMLSVTCKDYLVSSETSEVLRGSDTKINHYTYFLGFLVSSEAKELKNCPNCNAEIKSKGSNVKCEYCGSPIERKTNSLILNDKKMLQQY